MTSHEQLMKRVREGNASRQRSVQLPRDKYVVVKHNGRQKIYRVNIYGELFEQKQ